MSQLDRVEAESFQSTGSISINEDVSLFNKRRKDSFPLLGLHVNVGVLLARVQIHPGKSNVRELARCYFDHIGAQEC